MAMVKDLTITSLETITAFELVSGSYMFTLDELQSASIAQSQDSTDLTGKAGRKLSTLKRNKAVTISGSNGIVSGGLLAAQTGGTFDEKATEVMWTDYLTVSDSTATTYKAVGTVGAEIKALYIRNEDGTLGKKLEQASAAADGKFAYNPSTKVLTFHTDVTAGTEIVVYYDRKITANVLVDESDVFSKKASLYIDAFAEDKCGKIYKIQIFVPKADFSGEFTFEMGDNQTIHSFEAQALSGACGNGGAFFTYTVFGNDTPDVEETT